MNIEEFQEKYYNINGTEEHKSKVRNISALVEDTEKGIVFAISDMNFDFGMCNCCSDYRSRTFDMLKIIKIVNIETMEIIYEY